MERKTLIHGILLITALLLLGLLLIVFLRTGNVSSNKFEEEQIDCVDLMQILDRGRLDVSLGYNSLNYYILHGRPAGFQFELARYFSEHLGVELHITTTNDINYAISLLKTGEIDIVCAGLTIVSGRFGKEVDFSEQWASSSQVLVQNIETSSRPMVKSLNDLSGQAVYVPKGSVFRAIILNTCKNITPLPYVIEVPGFGSEQLIDAVAEGKIGLTVADFHLARYHSEMYENLDISVSLGNEQPLGWCVRSCSPALLDTLNSWLTSFKKSRQFEYLYYRYFVNPLKEEKSTGEYFSVKSGNISPWDDVIKKYSSEIGWDWRLIASLMYEESHFRTDLVSSSGAFGVMQLMPETARSLGVDSSSAPEEHIKAGIKLLKSMDDNLKSLVPDNQERIKFVLASYNLGEGHILDAIALSKKYNKNPRIWENNVEFFLIQKNQYKYYSDEVVKYGYCKGKIASIFVQNILERYEHYKNAFPTN